MRRITDRQPTELAFGRTLFVLGIVAIVVAVVLAAPLGSIGAMANADRAVGGHALRQASDPLLRPYAKLGGMSGKAIALSSDGSTALIGSEGSVTVYVRSGSTWIRQARLEPVGAPSGDAFGCSVALSADGDTALIGAPGRSASSSLTAVPSAAWVFIRSGSSWVQQPALRPPNEASAAEPLGCGASYYGGGKGFGGGFGSSVALSGDGSAALVAAPGADSYVGGVWAYIRSGSAWSQDGPKLLAPEASIGALFGASVAFSADGNTALISAPADIPPRCATTGTYAGGVWTFMRAAGTWTQQGTRLAPRRACEGSFGRSIALSSDADTALVSNAGRVLPFVRLSSSWSQQGPPLSCLGAECGALHDFSLSLALSGDGNVALVGAIPESNCGKYMNDLCYSHGLSLVFNRFGTTWVEQRPPLDGPTSLGSGVALAGSGESGLISEFGGTDAYLIPPPRLDSFSAGELATRRSGVLDQQIASSTAGTFTVSATVSSSELRLAQGSRHTLISYGRGIARVTGPGIVTVKIKPTPRVRRVLARHRSILPTLHITIRFRPHAGMAPTPQTFTVHLEEADGAR
jgi:hypothetical protein